MKVANAPCSWGVLEFGLEGETDKYQKVLQEMSSTGYVGTELGDWGFMPTGPDELKEELNTYKLDLVGAFVPINFINPDDHDKGLEIALKTANLLVKVGKDDPKVILSDDNGKNPVRTRNAGRIQPEHSLSTAEWQIYAEGVNKLAGKIMEETGLMSVFHHHCAGYVETPDEIDKFLNLTNPDSVGLCFDTGHYAFGGGDPVKGIKEHSERIRHVHFKDFDPSVAETSEQKSWDYFKSVENGVFCELGKGSVDFASILDELKIQKYSNWIVVEQDILPGMGSPKENAQHNRNFLHSIGI